MRIPPKKVWEIRHTLKETALGEMTVGYQELANMCELGLDLRRIDHRNALSKVLGEISTKEVKAGRPMLSAVVVLKDEFGNNTTPGWGFFDLAKELGRQKTKEPDFVFYGRELKALFSTWKKIWHNGGIMSNEIFEKK